MNYAQLYELRLKFRGWRAQIIAMAIALLQSGYINPSADSNYICEDSRDALDLAFELYEEMTGNWVDPEQSEYERMIKEV